MPVHCNLSGRRARYHWECCWIAYGLNRQVDIQPWPIQMVMGKPLHVRYLLNRPFSKPWELVKRHEQFFVFKQKPKTVLRHMGDLSRRSGGSRHFGSPLNVH